MPVKKSPTFLETARTFYGEAFDVRKKRELSMSMAEWAEMEPGEQSFAVAHLLYLDLHAQAQTHQLLGHVATLLDELAEAFTAAIEASIEEARAEHPDEIAFDEPEDIEPEPMVIDAEPASPSPGGEP